MIVRPRAVAGLLALAASSRIIVSAQPFSTLAAQSPEEGQQFGNVAEGADTDTSATHRPRPQPPRAPMEEEQHGEFGNVAESTAKATTNGQGGDNGQPGTFQFLGVSGGDDDGDEIDSPIA
jgi:hypothetical protein